MKAIISRKFGPPSLLEITEAERPKPVKNQVLIRVMATAINDYDWAMVRGQPYEFRFLYGFTRPKHPVPGMGKRIGDPESGNLGSHRQGTGSRRPIQRNPFGSGFSLF